MFFIQLIKQLPPKTFRMITRNNKVTQTIFDDLRKIRLNTNLEACQKIVYCNLKNLQFILMVVYYF